MVILPNTFISRSNKDPGKEEPEDNSDILDSLTHIHAVGDAFVVDGFSEELEILDPEA